MKILRKSPDGAKILGPYTPIVNFGDFYFISGQIGTNNQGLISDELNKEISQAMINLGNLLKSVDLSYNSIIKTTLYITDMSYYKKVNEIYATYFSKGEYPARAVVECTNLPANAKFEIESIAVKND